MGSNNASGRPLSQLAREITAGAVRLAAATAAWLKLVAEFDEREGWAGYGIASCAHWLAWQCGLSPGAAREHVRVARALRGLPLISGAFTEGRVSYSKVRALTRIAEPDTEASLLQFALEATASQVERTVRQWRRADTVAAETIRLKRQFESWWDDDGMLVLRVRMPAEDGAALLAAVDSLVERTARRERAQAKRDDAPPGDEADDAVALAREQTTGRRCAALAQLAGAAVGLDRRPGDPPRREVVVHVDAAVLADDAAAGRAYLEGGPPLHAAQARRMLCEASVVTMLEQGREVLAVGRTKRRATRAQRRALLRRDGGCARPGCPEARIERLHAHHLRHWLHGGRTDLTNLVLLCDVDHGLVHDLDLVMTRRDGRLIVTAPDGRRVWGAADTAFSQGVAGLHSAPVADGPGADRASASDEELFAGVHPIDQQVGRRPVTPAVPILEVDHEPAPGAHDGQGPAEAPPSVPLAGSRSRCRTGAARRPRATGVPGVQGLTPSRLGRRPAARPSRPVRPAALIRNRRTAVGGMGQRRLVAGSASIGSTLFPNGEPPLPDAMHVNGERMDMAYVVGVLMGNRDLVRRLAAETGLPPS
jgi:hypothetical protein